MISDMPMSFQKTLTKSRMSFLSCEVEQAMLIHDTPSTISEIVRYVASLIISTYPAKENIPFKHFAFLTKHDVCNKKDKML